MIQNKTYSAKARDIENAWWLVDAKGQTLGRMATRIATVLQGKHKPTYTPHLDDGDFIVVINAEQVKVTGKKATEKVYPYVTGYPSGLKERKFSDLIERDPGEVIRMAVKRMLPKNALGRRMLKKLKPYGGAEHPHVAQKPEPLDLSRI